MVDLGLNTINGVLPPFCLEPFKQFGTLQTVLNPSNSLETFKQFGNLGAWTNYLADIFGGNIKAENS